MLEIWGGIHSDIITDVDTVFDSFFEPEWLEQNEAKAMVMGIDKSEVLSPHCIESPVLGQIAPTYLQRGVKNLIMMLNMDETEHFWGQACGENCERWLFEIAKNKKVILHITNVMWFNSVKDSDFAKYPISFPQIDRTAKSREEFLDCMYAIADRYLYVGTIYVDDDNVEELVDKRLKEKELCEKFSLNWPLDAEKALEYERNSLSSPKAQQK